MSRINNSFRLSGFVGSDPEKRFNTTNGRGIISVSLGVDASYKDRDSGELVERTDWFDLTVYRESLVNVFEQYVRKGSEVHVRGTMSKQTWESKDRVGEDGKPRMESRYQFIVTEMRLGRRPKDGTAGADELGNSNSAASDFIDDEHPF